MHFLECLFLTIYIPLESFSAMEQLASPCLALIPGYHPLLLTVFLGRKREWRPRLDLDAHELLGWPRGYYTFSDFLWGPYSKYSSVRAWTRYFSFISLKADCGPLCPRKTNILVGWARNTSDIWNCCCRTAKREIFMYLYCAIFFFFSFNLLLSWSYSIRHSISMPAMR